MISEEQFVSLLERMEDETLDFKARGYDLTNEKEKFSFVKDVLCMANTPRESTSFIVLGVKKYPDGAYDLRGLETHPDEADLQSQFTDRVYPIPNFTYDPVTYDSKRFGVIAIQPTRIGPSLPINDFKGTLQKEQKKEQIYLRKWQFYFRRGSKNDIAVLPEDIGRILSWFGKQVPPSLAYKDEGPSWESLLRELQNFDPARYLSSS